jgi:hypothetical protein
MEAPPLLLKRTPNQQIILAIVVPAVFGLICGILLGVSKQVYLLLQLLAAIGGVGAGYEMESASEGAGRGFAGGMLFGTFILFGNAFAGLDEKMDLPSPHILLPVFTTIFGVLLGALGGALRARHEKHHPVGP